MTGKDLIETLKNFGESRELLFFNDKGVRLRIDEIVQEGKDKILITLDKYIIKRIEV